MVDKLDFATIEEIPLRNYFSREDTNFTPWLRDNIQLLGDTIGIDIVDPSTEVPIGTYRLDILANESGTSRKIAIENQFGVTDHDHLGKLLTYMAGVNADVVIWVAEGFKDEHITAINHLNQISNSDTAFFCIRPRLIRIEKSKPAFEFSIITQPDEWEKANKPQGSNELEREYSKFWSLLIDEHADTIPNLKNRVLKYNSLGFRSGKPGFSYGWRFTREKTFDLVLWIDTGDNDKNKDIFNELKGRKQEIESKLGKNVGYFSKENVRMVVLYLKNDIRTDILNLDEKERNDIVQWSMKWLPKFRETFDVLIKEM